MTLPAPKKIAENPVGTLLIGLVSALLLGSLASAGLNTLTVARLMIVASFLLCIGFVYASTPTRSMTRRERIWATVAILALHVGLQRIEATYSPPAKRFVVPPLSLLLPPSVPGFLYPETPVPNLPLMVTCIPRPIAGFAGFGVTGDNANDDVAMGLAGFGIRNTADRPLRLEFRLAVKGEGVNVTLSGDGKGRWERQLNKNDWDAQRGLSAWVLSPLLLPASGSLPIPSQMAFVAPAADEAQRSAFRPGELAATYSATLVIRDLDTGQEASLPLPFGIPPRDAGNPVWRDLHEKLRRTGALEKLC